MDIMGLVKQAQGLQAKMQKVQEELALATVDGTSGGGMVVVTMNGKFDIKSVTIDPTAVKPDDAPLLEDLIVAAARDAKSKAEALVQARMGEATAGLPLPPGMKLF